MGSVEATEAARLAPPDYRGLVRHIVRDGLQYTVVLFPHDRTHGPVTTSALVRRALGRIAPAERVLAIGADFTREATALLAERGAAVARIGEFGWTDESYTSIRDRAR